MRRWRNGRERSQSVAMSKRKGLILGGLVIVLALIAFAWIDGGRREIHEISQPVAVPEAAR